MQLIAPQFNPTDLFISRTASDECRRYAWSLNQHCTSIAIHFSAPLTRDKVDLYHLTLVHHHRSGSIAMLPCARTPLGLVGRRLGSRSMQLGVCFLISSLARFHPRLKDLLATPRTLSLTSQAHLASLLALKSPSSLVHRPNPAFSSSTLAITPLSGLRCNLLSTISFSVLPYPLPLCASTLLAFATLPLFGTLCSWRLFPPLSPLLSSFLSLYSQYAIYTTRYLAISYVVAHSPFSSPPVTPYSYGDYL